MPEIPNIPGLQDNKLRELVSFLIKQSPLSRDRIADEMSKSLGRPGMISRRMLDDWTSESHKSARFPLCYLEAFCCAIGDDRLQRWAAGAKLRELIEFAERHLELQERRAELMKPCRKVHAKRSRIITRMSRAEMARKKR